MSIKDEFEKAHYERTGVRLSDAITPESIREAENLVWAAKWMAEKNIEVIQSCFNPAKAVSQIRELLKGLDT